MAKKAYVGVNNVARNVKAIYVGVNGKARKVVKAYVGVNGVARRFWLVPKYITFSSNIIPTTWTGTSTAANTQFTATSTYGTWTVYGTQAATSSSYIASKAVDSSTTTAYEVSGQNYYFYVLLPTGISINPTKMSYKLRYSAKNFKIEGRREGTSTWDTLYTNTSLQNSSSGNSAEPTMSSSYYYDRIRIYHPRIGSNYTSSLYYFRFLNGTIKDAR